MRKLQEINYEELEKGIKNIEKYFPTLKIDDSRKRIKF